VKLSEFVPLSKTSIGDKEIARAVAVHFGSEFSDVLKLSEEAVSSCAFGLGSTINVAGLGRQSEAEAFFNTRPDIHRAFWIGKPLQVNELGQLAQRRDQNATGPAGWVSSRFLPLLRHSLSVLWTQVVLVGVGRITGTSVGFRSRITLSR
jgi:hypothetical protein